MDYAIATPKAAKKSHLTRGRQKAAIAGALAMLLVALIIATLAVGPTAAGFFDIWQSRPAYSGGYAQSAAFGRRRR